MEANMPLELNEIQIRLVNILEATYKPLEDFARQSCVLTTEAIYKHLQSLWPSEDYCTLDVYEVLRYLKIDGVASQTTSKYFWLLEEI